MTEQPEPICRFYRLIPDAPVPRRADRSADGMLPVRAYRYCEAVAAASAFGWYIYPPLNFSLVWTGTDTHWTYEGADGWFAVRSAQYPGFLEIFENDAPDIVKPLAPPFLTLSREPGVVQVWSGYLARTAPGWALLSRGPANIPANQGYDNFEGIVETETWFGTAIHECATDPECAGRVSQKSSDVPGPATLAPVLQRAVIRGA